MVFSKRRPRFEVVPPGKSRDRFELHRQKGGAWQWWVAKVEGDVA